MEKKVAIIGAGLAGSEASLQLAKQGVDVTLFERRPNNNEPVHKTGLCAELVCSNSLKSTKPDSAAGMLKLELDKLGSYLYRFALDNSVDAGGALAVNRDEFAQAVTEAIDAHPNISRIHANVSAITDDGHIAFIDEQETIQEHGPFAAVILATGPLTSDAMAKWLEEQTSSESLAFYDAAAPIVLADSLDMDKVFRQSRYESDGEGDYLNAPFSKEEYDIFVNELISAKKVISKDFETKELFQACQPVEEIARKGHESLRHGTMKPVGLTDPSTGSRPWAVLQLRAEDKWGQSYNLVGCQTNLTFPEQQRIFRLVPGLEQAEFTRFGVMHRNTFVDSPRCLNPDQTLQGRSAESVPVYLAGQVSGTEGYCEAIRSGLQAALNCTAYLRDIEMPDIPVTTAFGSLLAYATDPTVKDYQPKHVNFGDQPPIDPPIRNKRQRYAALAKRGKAALDDYCQALFACGLLKSGDD